MSYQDMSVREITAPRKPFIVTAQPFFNELDLIELKFQELAGEVDAHVIVESDLTFSGIEKPLYFQENRSRFKEFNVIHAVAQLPLACSSPWVREEIHRRSVFGTVQELKPDIVLWLDADELPRRGTVKRFLESGHKTMTLAMETLLFGFDRLDPTTVDINSKIGLFDPNAPHQPWRGEEHPLLEKSGWHLEFFGSWRTLKEKLKATSHANEPGGLDMFRRVEKEEQPGIERTVPYPISDLPVTVQANRSKYQHSFYEYED